MKNILLLLTITLCSLTTHAQEDQKGFNSWLNFGVGKYSSPGKQSQLTEINTGLNFLLHQKHYFGVHWGTAFSKHFVFNPNQLYFQNLKYVNYGQREKFRKGIYFTQSIGIGLANYSITRFYRESSTDVSNFLTDILFDATGKTVYANYQEQAVCVPIRMEVSFASPVAALGIGFDMVLMKYPSIGISADLQFGKVRGIVRNTK